MAAAAIDRAVDQIVLALVHPDGKTVELAPAGARRLGAEIELLQQVAPGEGAGGIGRLHGVGGGDGNGAQV